MDSVELIKFHLTLIVIHAWKPYFLGKIWNIAFYLAVEKEDQQFQWQAGVFARIRKQSSCHVTIFNQTVNEAFLNSSQKGWFRGLSEDSTKRKEVFRFLARKSNSWKQSFKEKIIEKKPHLIEKEKQWFVFHCWRKVSVYSCQLIGWLIPVFKAKIIVQVPSVAQEKFGFAGKEYDMDFIWWIFYEDILSVS